MSERVYVSSKVEPGDKLTVIHNPERPWDLGGVIPESVYVEFGTVSVWGSPDLMATMLDRALTQVQWIIDNKEEK